MNQAESPLYDAVLGRAKRRLISFQTPSHNNGLVYCKKTKRDITKNLFDLDFSVCGNVDSLDNPRTYIKEAQKAAASAYGVKKSYFLVNGSTMGNQIMFLSSFHHGDKVIIPRNIHKSILSSIVLSGVRPVWIFPEFSEEKNITYNVLSSQIEKAILKHPDVKGVLIVSPTYHGIVADLTKIKETVAKYNKLLLVDEAWGAHLCFHSEFPGSAVTCADICIQSFHKMLPSLNQSSILHINSDRIDVTRVEQTINLLQTTSPSYLTLALMDHARMLMATKGHEILSQVLRQSSDLRQNIKSLGLRTLSEQDIKQQSEEFSLDPAKVTIFTNELGITGYELEKVLDKDFGIQVECGNYDNIIVIIKPGLDKQHMIKLIKALKQISDQERNKNLKIQYEFNSFHNEQVIEPQEAFFRQSKWVDFENAKGKISAETISVYPPGIPVLIPGERISSEVFKYLFVIKQKGASISSLDRHLKKIRVVEI